jgi:colicin import membrane protein
MILDRPEEPGKNLALAFTVVVHAALLAFLFFGVQWKRSQPEAMEVELWSPTPKQATYVPPTPHPEVKPEPPKPEPKVEPPKPESKIEAPKKPDIVVKKDEKKPEPKKPEPPKPEPPKPEQKKPEPPKPEVKKPDPPKFDFSKELAQETKQLKPSPQTQHLANAAAAEAEQRAAAANKGLQAWGDKVSRHIRQYVVLPGAIQGNPQSIYEFRVLPSGDVLQPLKLKKSSGNPALDAAVERAIIKASPLPKPDSGSFPNPLEIKYKPFEE